MRKKTLIIIVTLMLMISSLATRIYADEGGILGETLVYTYVYLDDLPKQYVKNSEIEHYDYGGQSVLDFRHYFEVYDNAEIILDMHNRDGEIDRGGYVWDFGGFDITEEGFYTITLSYAGVTGDKSNSIELEVIAEDTEAPEIFMQDANFNKIRLDKDDEFNREFDRFLHSIRVYDKVDGLIKITKEHFPEEEIARLKAADLREKVTITLNISDKNNNESSKTITLTIVDLKAPNIHNVKTVVTKKGKRINYTAHLDFSDNYSEKADIYVKYEIYKTLVQMNLWEAGDRRAEQSKGNELGNYLRLAASGLESFIDFLDANYSESYLVGDYYRVFGLDDQTNYVYIKEKVETPTDDGSVFKNVWEITTDRKDLKGISIESYTVIAKDKNNLLQEIIDDHETGFQKFDYFKINDLVADSRYFIYIKEKEDDLRDQQDNINFSKIGVQYVYVEAQDQFGNISSVRYRVVIEDGITLLQSVLIINGIVLVVAAAGVAVFMVTRKRK
jgi:hypothetical protein